MVHPVARFFGHWRGVGGRSFWVAFWGHASKEEGRRIEQHATKIDRRRRRRHLIFFWAPAAAGLLACLPGKTRKRRGELKFSLLSLSYVLYFLLILPDLALESPQKEEREKDGAGVKAPHRPDAESFIFRVWQKNRKSTLPRLFGFSLIYSAHVCTQLDPPSAAKTEAMSGVNARGGGPKI